MTTLTESQNIDCETGRNLDRPRSKKPNLKNQIFGSSLKDLRERNDKYKSAVPYVLYRLCTFIEMKGLTERRLFSSECNQKQIEYMKSCFDQIGDAPLETEGNVLITANLLKLFLLELADPVIPTSMQLAFTTALNGHNREECMYNLKQSLQNIPPKNYIVVKYLSKFLHKVTCHEEENETDAAVLGSIFSPLLFRVKQIDTKQKLLMDEVVIFFISDYYNIFGSEKISISTPESVSHEKYIVSPTVFQSIENRKISPVPSSVMPLLPLKPLSVDIPPLDDDLLALTSLQSTGLDSEQVPVLIIDSELKSSKYMIKEKVTIGRNDNILSRKRKERRPSGEDLQPLRSSSEERPPFKKDEELFLTGKEHIRRFNSHEEVRALSDSIDNENNQLQREVGINKQNINSKIKYSITTVKELAFYDIRDHSPHPPKPKRREIDFTNHHEMQFIEEKYNSLVDISNGSNMFKKPLYSTNNHIDFEKKATAVNNYQTKEYDKVGNGCWKEENVLFSQMEEEEETDSLKENVIKQKPIKYGNKINDDKIFNNNGSTLWNDDSYNGFQEEKFISNEPHSKTYKQTLESSICDYSELSCNHSEFHSGYDISCQEKFISSPDKTDVFPPLDLTSLHEHSEGTEPVLSEHRFSWPLLKAVQDDDAMLSPSVNFLRKASSYEAPLSPSAYKSYLSHRSLHLDPNIPPSPPVEQDDFCKSSREEDPANSSIKQLNKKIHSLKKKLKQFDEAFEEEHGYRPSHAEKMNFPDIKKIITHLNKARKDLKALKEESQLSEPAGLSVRPHWLPTRDVHILEDTTNNRSSCESCNKLKPSVEESLDEALKDLSDKRKCAHRPEIVEDMTDEQVMDEKIAIQKALLQLESIHGRPTNKMDRDIMRPLYDRYRNVKRILGRPNTSNSLVNKNKDTGTELQPILEHVAMDFTSPKNIPKNDFPEMKEEASILCKESTDNSTEEILSSEWITKYNSSNLHELPLSELLYQQQQARSEKRRLRRVLREFEEEFQQQTGRKIQKEDKAPMEALYGEYKHVKGRLRLLEALLSKHDQCK